ncbi:MAG: ergothioneine biosynthesis protein EgtB [Acidocella sp.]|nr:ergothioneine biosynthesis protein EgtB [Acidocella sp.]
MLRQTERAPKGDASQPVWRDKFAQVRAASLRLVSALSPEDCVVQSMPDASPVKWHLAHTSWFFETFILEAFEPDFSPFDPSFRVLFNSYYNGIGDKYPRLQRGMVTRPGLDEVLAYRRDVDTRMAALFARELPPARGGELAGLVALGLQHEQQHQELIVTDIKHLFSLNPAPPPYPSLGAPAKNDDLAQEWVEFSGGLVEIGHAGGGFCFDNEMPRHRQFLEPYALSSRLVTNGEYAAFIDDGGYRNPAFWLSDGWAFLQANATLHPLYWAPDGSGGWCDYTARGVIPIDPAAPCVHLSFYEAAAFALWAGARLPTEAEWEHAALSDGLAQMFGTAWQWTSSSYAPYPGFAAAAGAVGEYNGKFMVNQYVLRGSSVATPPGHARITYRNFFPASARWQFMGIRLAR